MVEKKIELHDDKRIYVDQNIQSLSMLHKLFNPGTLAQLRKG